MLVHKRLTANKLCVSWSVQLCSPLKNHTFDDWEKINKHTAFHWRLVTCPTCLSLKGDKKVISKAFDTMNELYKRNKNELR